MPSKRKLAQLYFALLFNAHLKGFITGNIYKGDTKNLCAPGINCYSCPGAVAACPVGSLQGSFSSANKGTLFYVGGILLLYCIIFGRTICGWLCPFGFIQELFYKLKTPKVKKSKFTRILSYLKYVFLVFFVFIIPITYAFRNLLPLPAFCKYICPAGTLEGGVGLLSNPSNEAFFDMLGPLFTWKFALMVSILVGCVFIFRLFCRFICPLGALYGLFNRFSLLGVKVEAPKCTSCQKCVSHCKMDINRVGDTECIGCGECIDVCPTKAISFKGSQILLRDNEIEEGEKPYEKVNKRRFITLAISTTLALALLVGVLSYYWTDDSQSGDTPPIITESEGEESDENLPEYGNQIGNRCFGAKLNIVDESGILEETVNPVESGKITVINFWGTWCTPCVNELPYFDQIASEFSDSVSVYAIHTDAVANTAPAFIEANYKDSLITFACDGENEFYYSTLGGKGAYPYTIILDENGVIASIHLSSVDYETLKQDIEALIP